MDAYRPYMRPPAPPPPPPSSVDPHFLQYQQQAAAPPRPPQGPWFPNQLQYNNPSQSPSTPPPPPWGPPPPPPPPPAAPHSDHMPPPAYPTPPHPYPPHHGQPPPRPYLPPPQHLNPYPPQDWSGPNWNYQQGWNPNHQAQNGAEDWAARAKAWASAKAAMESQHPPAHYQNQYPQAVESQYADNRQHSASGSAYQQHPHSATPPNGQPVHLQENPSVGSGPASYLPDGRMVYPAKDGPPSGDTNAVFHPQEHLHANQSVHQQEVPSSYSSVSGKDDQNEKLPHLPRSAAQEGISHLQAPMPGADGSFFPYANQYTDPITNPADQPLEFTSRFNRDQDLLAQSVYAHHDSTGPLRGIDPVVSMPSVHTWTSSMTPDVAYPSISTVLPSGSQHDPSIPIPSPVSGHAPSFPRFSGPGFQPNIPPPSGTFGLGVGPSLPLTGGFSADSYGLSGSAERPKKGPVPNWLREEIIKTKASITSSSLVHPKDEVQSIEDEGADKSFEKGDQADSKSMDSSKSTEEEDDDEDYVEAARTAAINQEIKRVLTEVLLKVTDELFDEIATKVLNEDDQVAEDNHEALAPDRMVSPTSRAPPAARASAKARALVETKDLQNEDVGEKSSSSSGRNILGLANYASDDEDGEIQSSDVPNSTEITRPRKSDSIRPQHDANGAPDNETQPVAIEEHLGAPSNSDSNYPRTSVLESRKVGDGLGNDEVNRASNLASAKVSRGGDKNNFNGKMMDGASASVSKETYEEKEKLLGEEVDARKSAMDDTRDVEIRERPTVTARYGDMGTSRGNSSEEPESNNIKVDEKLDENHRNKDGRHLRKEKTERFDSKETKNHGKYGEKSKESEGRKRSGLSDIKEDRKDRERPHRDYAKDDSRRRERSRDMEDDRSRHKASRDMSRHKRRRSSSSGSRGGNSRDHLATHGRDSTDEDSDDSRRKLRSRRRSPSPVRSRRRQVSRSPHSKDSQRRHSPYSSLEGSRERRRSRSRSPVRRHR